MSNAKLAKKKLLSITKPQEEWLVKQAAKLGISVSEFLRRIIDAARSSKK